MNMKKNFQKTKSYVKQTVTIEEFESNDEGKQ